MERNPLGLNGRHRAPRRTGHRIAAIIAAGGILAGAALLATPHAHAATRTELGAPVAHAATVASERITPSAHPVTPDRTGTGWTRADRRVCKRLAVFDTAGLPSDQQISNLARAGLHATRAYRNADGQLMMALAAEGSFGRQDLALQRLCGQD